MNKLFKRITAGVLAAASIAAIGMTASAETIYKPPVDWMAVYVKGAPTSVNKKYTYPMYTYGGGFDITCTEFVGDYDKTVTIWRQHNQREYGEIRSKTKEIDDIHAKTQSKIVVDNPNITADGKVTFVFYASSPKSFATCRAYGVITYHE